MHTSLELIYPAVACICAAFLSYQRQLPYREMQTPLALTGVAVCLLHFVIGGWHDLMSAAIFAVVAAVIFSLLHIFGGIPLQDVVAISVVAMAAGSQHAISLLLFTAVVGAIMSCFVAEKRQKITHFISTCIRESTHVPYQECVLIMQPYVSPEVTLRRHYGHAVTVGALLTLVQAAIL